MPRPTKQEALDAFMQVIGQFYAEQREAPVGDPAAQPQPVQATPRKQLYAVLRALSGGDRRTFEIAQALDVGHSGADAMLRILANSGLLIVMPDLDLDVPQPSGWYRLGLRARALVQSDFSWDNPYEQALQKIEFIIDSRKPTGLSRTAYIDAWEEIAGMAYKQRGVTQLGMHGIDPRAFFDHPLLAEPGLVR